MCPPSHWGRDPPVIPFRSTDLKSGSCGYLGGNGGSSRGGGTDFEQSLSLFSSPPLLFPGRWFCQVPCPPGIPQCQLRIPLSVWYLQISVTAHSSAFIFQMFAAFASFPAIFALLDFGWLLFPIPSLSAEWNFVGEPEYICVYTNYSWPTFPRTYIYKESHWRSIGTKTIYLFIFKSVYSVNPVLWC